MNLLREGGRIRKYAVVIGLGIQLPIPKDQHPASSAESADVRKKIKVIKRNLEGLHASHRKAGHCSMISIRKCPEVGIDKRNQSLRHVVFKCSRHLLHGLQHFGRTKRLSS